MKEATYSLVPMMPSWQRPTAEVVEGRVVPRESAAEGREAEEAEQG